jgi:hypothetical protein
MGRRRARTLARRQADRPVPLCPALSPSPRRGPGATALRRLQLSTHRPETPLSYVYLSIGSRPCPTGRRLAA